MQMKLYKLALDIHVHVHVHVVPGKCIHAVISYMFGTD